MLSPKVAQRPSVTLVSRGSASSPIGTAPTLRRATPGARRHTPTTTTAPQTTNPTAPTTGDRATQHTTPTTSAGTRAVYAHRASARRRLAATRSGWTGGGATATTGV